jgi:thioredoxin 1
MRYGFCDEAPMMNRVYAQSEPKRAEVDALGGATLLEFGSPWCGYCRRAQPLLEAALAAHPGVRHLKIADASGRRLGRSFGVKLWPTLVFLKDGREVVRLVRPGDSDEISRALAQVVEARDAPFADHAHLTFGR